MYRNLLIYNGAQGRNRTGTVLPPRDFKSLASTNFATWADDCICSNHNRARLYHGIKTDGNCFEPSQATFYQFNPSLIHRPDILLLLFRKSSSLYEYLPARLAREMHILHQGKAAPDPAVVLFDLQ